MDKINSWEDILKLECIDEDEIDWEQLIKEVVEETDQN